MPALVDDLGLSASVFRVYFRIVRRGSCYEGVPEIARGCRMNEDTVKRALRELLDRGMIARTKRPGFSSIYEPLPPPWAPPPGGKEGPAPETSQPDLLGHPVETEGRGAVESEGRPPGENRGHEGYPKKGYQEGYPEKESVPAELPLEPTFPAILNTPEFKAAWNDWLAYRRERKLPAYKPKSLAAQLNALASWGVEAAIASIRDSIRNQWQGLFQPRNQFGSISSGANRYQQRAVTAEEHGRGFFDESDVTK